MYSDISNAEFDYVILGTSLTESTLSGYLSKQGKKVLQIEISKSYGGDCKSFNLKEMETFISESSNNQCKDPFLKQYKLLNRFITQEDIFTIEKHRDYNFDLNPKYIYAQSKATEELTNSNASNYMEFTSVQHIYFYYLSKLLTVPFTKSEIFTSKDIDLLEKQKLLAFLYAIMKLKNTDVDVNTTADIKKDYELDNTILNALKENLQEKCEVFLAKNFSVKIQAMILLILGNIDPNSKCDMMTVDMLIARIYKFLVSVQVYDNTPLLNPLYGCSEFSQALCRISSVYGGIFLVNEDISIKVEINEESRINKEEKRFVVNVNDACNKEVFNVRTSCVIMNEVFLGDKESHVELGSEVVMECKENGKMLRYVCYAVVKHITQLRKVREGPFYYKVRKNDEELKNCYGFSAIESFRNSYSAPRHRSVLQICIINEEGCDEEGFVENCKKIVNDFIGRRLKDIEEEIKECYEERKGEEDYEELMEYVEIVNKEKDLLDILVNEEKDKSVVEEKLTVLDKPIVEDKLTVEKPTEDKQTEDKPTEDKPTEDKPTEDKPTEDKPTEDKSTEDKPTGDKPKQDVTTNTIKKRYQHPKEPKEKLEMIPKVIIQYDFLQVIPLNDYSYTQSSDKTSDIILTSNNYINIDLDYYYEECESIIKRDFFLPLTENPKVPEEVQQQRLSSLSDDTNLIDELFNSIQLPEPLPSTDSHPKDQP